MAAVQTDLLQLILASNRVHFERVLPIIRSYGVKRVGMLGLAFKSGTDDLRESPLVLLAETLIGQGYDLRIHDPDVGLANLVGTNQRYIDQHLPHLARYLCGRDELADHSHLLIFNGSRTPVEEVENFEFPRIDLDRVLIDGGTPVANPWEPQCHPGG